PMSQKSRLYSSEVSPSAKPATIQAHMPAIEIAFGDTFCEANHVVADCAHFRFRVAIGRRSIALADDSFIAAQSIAGLMSDDQLTTWERVVHLSQHGYAPSCTVRLHSR